MAKKTFGIPLVLGLITEAPDVTETGAHTGQHGSDPITDPISFEAWAASDYAQGYDYNQNGEYDIEEYAAWWIDEGFDLSDWDDLNPNHPWDPDWE